MHLKRCVISPENLRVKETNRDERAFIYKKKACLFKHLKFSESKKVSKKIMGFKSTIEPYRVLQGPLVTYGNSAMISQLLLVII